MKGQLSAEMIILVAVILAVVAIVAVSITQSAQKGSEVVENRTNDIIKNSGEAANAAQAEGGAQSLLLSAIPC